jgi:hypothetical protein
MKVIYIAGPFRDQTPWRVELNVRRAEVCALKIVELGFAPLIPHTMYRYYTGAAPDQYWLDATRELLTRCDAVWFLDNWANSQGSVGEYQTATRLGIPTFTGEDALLKIKEFFNAQT